MRRRRLGARARGLVHARGLAVVTSSDRPWTASAPREEVHERDLRTLVRESADGLIVIDPEGVVQFANPAAERILGRPGRTLDGIRVALPLTVDGPREIDIDVGDGRRTVEARVVVIQWEGSRALLASIRDVTGPKPAETLFRGLVESAPYAMVIIDDDTRVVMANAKAEEVFGYATGEMHKLSLADLLPERFRDKHAFQVTRFFKNPHPRPLRAGLDLYALRKDGRELPVEISLGPLKTGQGTFVAATIEDITDRRRREDSLRHLADHDPLTGLLNRRSFEHEISAHRARSQRYGGGGAAIMLDLDRFKLINDTLGHNVGDQTIVRAAQAFRSRLRETDVLARLGGDEFAVLLPYADALNALLVAEELLDALRREPLEIHGYSLALAASAGIALFEGGEDVPGEDVLVKADSAMYAAKNAGRDQAKLYVADDHGVTGVRGRDT
jgi:diguanylate cyclase (GGDEF)-like protein/PAS domain S-box-containing protein